MNKDIEKIEFLMKILKEEVFSMDLNKAHGLVVAYKWLLDKYKEEQAKDAN